MKHYKEFASRLKKSKVFVDKKPVLGGAKRHNKTVSWKEPLVEVNFFYAHQESNETIDKERQMNEGESNGQMIHVWNGIPIKQSIPIEEQDEDSRVKNSCVTYNVLVRAGANGFCIDSREQQEISSRSHQMIPLEYRRYPAKTDYEEEMVAAEFHKRREFLWKKILELEGDWV